MGETDKVDVVTGGAGFIGSHLVDRLLAAGRRVRVVDDLSVGRRSNLSQHTGNPSLEIMEGDVADRSIVQEACEGAARVFHLAARADIVPSITDPTAYFRSNVDGTFSALEAARANNVERFIYVASSSCYGIPSVYPTPEDAPIDCRYPYALTKHLGEQLVLHWDRVYGMKTVVLRLFNVYGPRARTSGTYGAVFGVFLAQLLAGEPLTIVGDGEQTRDFTYVADVVDALERAAVSDQRGVVYNVGSGAPASVNDIVRLLGAAEVVHLPKRPGEPDSTWADISKIRADLDWAPSTPIEVGVARLLEHRDHWRDAPVWTAEKIQQATADWFRYLGNDWQEGNR